MGTQNERVIFVQTAASWSSAGPPSYTPSSLPSLLLWKALTVALNTFFRHAVNLPSGRGTMGGFVSRGEAIKCKLINGNLYEAAVVDLSLEIGELDFGFTDGGRRQCEYNNMCGTG